MSNAVATANVEADELQASKRNQRVNWRHAKLHHWISEGLPRDPAGLLLACNLGVAAADREEGMTSATRLLTKKQHAAIRRHEPKRRGRVVSSLLPAVSIDTDYPSEAVMDELRKLPVPKLKKTSKSLF